MIEEFFEWLDNNNKVQIPVIAIIYLTPLIYFIDGSTDWEKVMTIHWYNQDDKVSILNGIGFNFIFCCLFVAAFSWGKDCLENENSISKYFIYSAGIIGVFSFISTGSSRVLGNYIYFTTVIYIGLLVAIWSTKNKMVERIVAKSVLIGYRIFGGLLILFVLTLWGMLIYDGFN